MSRWQVLAVYVILGIGADDIFVLFDAFQQSPRQHGSAYRLSWALRRAVSAMAVTIAAVVELRAVRR